MSNNPHYKTIIEAALLSAGRPLTVDHLELLFTDEMQPPTRREIRLILAELQQDCEMRGIELMEVASGFRFQVKTHLNPWLKQLLNRRSPRYSRALLETLALVAYRQPITRAEIEKIRGVSVSTQIMRNLQDYQWIRVIGHRETPGRPALYGTTKGFLDHFNLKHLGDLPTLSELRNLELQPDLPDDEEEDELSAEALPGETVRVPLLAADESVAAERETANCAELLPAEMTERDEIEVTAEPATAELTQAVSTQPTAESSEPPAPAAPVATELEPLPAEPDSFWPEDEVAPELESQSAEPWPEPITVDSSPEPFWPEDTVADEPAPFFPPDANQTPPLTDDTQHRHDDDQDDPTDDTGPNSGLGSN